MFGLALLFVYVFLLSFWHFDHLAWGRGSWSLCLSCICLLAMHTLICVTVSLPAGISGWLRLLLVALPVLFCLPFCLFSILFLFYLFIFQGEGFVGRVGDKIIQVKEKTEMVQYSYISIMDTKGRYPETIILYPDYLH